MIKGWENREEMLFYDKSKLIPNGQWQSEPDKVLWIDDLTGLHCMIRRGPAGFLCGYVAIDSEHSEYGEHYDAVNVNVHGGLTYGDFCLEMIEGGLGVGICRKVENHEDKAYWLGFDCGHLNDMSPHERMRDFELNGREYRNIEYVKRQCESLAAQLVNQRE